MSTVRPISEHREKKNAAILAELGARASTIRALTRREPAANFAIKKGENYEISKNLKPSSTSSIPLQVMKADVFIRIFNNLNSKIGRNYSKSERFIKAYITYCDCLGSVQSLNINTCYRVLEDTINSHWHSETCINCDDEFNTVTGELLCPSCAKVKQISCTRCGGPNDRVNKEKVGRGHPKTVCTTCKSIDAPKRKVRSIS